MSERPNILLVLCDQLSALATPLAGNRDVLMPHLEELAEEATVFQRAYCNAPLCVPSRASMLTGRLAGRLPVNDNGEELPASVPTFAHHLRRGGYRTALAGKMHFIGPDQLHGFEERLTTDIYPSEMLWIPTWVPGEDPGVTVGASGELYAERVKESGRAVLTRPMEYDRKVHFETLQHLRRLSRASSEQPWFLCASYTHPHDPYIAPEECWQRYEATSIRTPASAPSGHRPAISDSWVRRYWGVDQVEISPEVAAIARRAYYAMASFVDDRLGELLAELETLGFRERTIVIFTSDHGDMLGEHGMWHKCNWREWSARVPLLFSGPGLARGARVQEPVSLVDLYPTLLELAGLEPAPADWVDGQSLAAWVHRDGGGGPAGRAVIENLGAGTAAPIRALVKEGFKYVYVHGQEELLFDLEHDPEEWFDLSADPAHQERLAALRAETLRDWDPDQACREVVASQRRRLFLREALARGRHTPWDYQPPGRAAESWVRRDPADPIRARWMNGH